jgi:membrane-bound lytic murein transglycosylase D
LRVIREQNINYLDNFWDLYERLPRETSRYVPRFLATLHVVKNPDKYGITLPTPDAPLAYETVTIAKPVHLKDIAAKFDIPIDELKKLNPELRYNILPEENYSLRMPPGKGEILLAEIDKIPVSQPPSPAYAFHKVRSGETLSSIANRYKTSVRNVMYANGMRRSNYIVVGTTLKIPLRGTVVYNPSVGYTQPKSKPVSQYRVKSGDSLWNIAKRFGTTTTAIQNLNNLSNNSLKIGQKLKIPGKAYAKNSAGSASAQSVYVVKRGDSPALIAKNHRMTVSRLLSLNKLTPTCKIFPGQQLFIE